MSRRIEGLWLGGEISVSAAEMVETAVRRYIDADTVGAMRERQELVELANAIRAQIQAVPPDPMRFL